MSTRRLCSWCMLGVGEERQVAGKEGLFLQSSLPALRNSNAMKNIGVLKGDVHISVEVVRMASYTHPVSNFEKI